jgi:type I restriction enzyme, S subunit
VEAAIEKLQEYRTAVITAAVTGKIDVRKAADSAGSTPAQAANTLPV